MKLFKYAIFYTFIGFYQLGIFVKQLPSKFRSTTPSTELNSGYRFKTTLLRAAFRSIL